MKPLFVTFEGGEGAGKTTQVELLSKWMKRLNIPHVTTKEPGSPHIAECERIRKLVLDPSNKLVPAAELMIFLADRAQHVEKLINPKLKEGFHVICDRYIDSTRVYQGVSRGLGRTKLDQMIEFATRGLVPDVTFVFDIPPEIGLERAKAKGGGKGDRMEQESLEFHSKVRQGFLRLGESLVDQGRVIMINAAPPKIIEEIHQEIVGHMSNKLWIGEGIEDDDE